MTAAPYIPRFERVERYRKEIDQATLPGAAVRHFAEAVANVAGGVQAIVDLLMDDQRRSIRREDADVPEDDDRPLLTIVQVEPLQQLAITSMQLLDSECDNLMEWAFEHHTTEGRNERFARARSLLADKE